MRGSNQLVARFYKILRSRLKPNKPRELNLIVSEARATFIIINTEKLLNYKKKLKLIKDTFDHSLANRTRRNWLQS